ncbi:phage major capsid protein [Streptomyces sp. NPDC048507]|uniref:phage major capsid protein n=1 Tax=Streptomyces sp. NPDC048507 TaxID=3365560 RepID=UPI0037237C4C
MGFTDVEHSNPDLLPIEWSQQVIKNVAQTSAVMALSQRRTMSTRQARMPATAALAGAYWVGNSANDFTDLKQTTSAEWTGKNLIVEELAALVVIPDAYAQDSGFPIWDEVQPQVVEALGRALDAAVLFGVNKPATWPAAIFDGATAATQTTAASATEDLAKTAAKSAQKLVQRGYTTNGFAATPGIGWELVGMRNSQGAPIYQTDLAGAINTGLYGFPMREVTNGSWDPAKALMIHGDWSKSLLGIRQDITFTQHPSGVISDATGKVVANAMQMDSTIWRAVMRIAWTAAEVATRLGPNPDTATGKYPFAAVTPAVTPPSDTPAPAPAAAAK